MGTARDAILEAFLALERETGHEEFRLSQVVDRVLASTKDFQETTLRTYVTSVMCVDAPVHHANHTDDLVRVGRGMYRRAGLSEIGENVMSQIGPRGDWDVGELMRELDRFEGVLLAARLKKTTVETYVERTRVFLRWLDGKYEPRGPNA